MNGWATKTTISHCSTFAARGGGRGSLRCRGGGGDGFFLLKRKGGRGKAGEGPKSSISPPYFRHSFLYCPRRTKNQHNVVLRFPWAWEKESRGQKPKSLKKVSKKSPGARSQKSKKKSRKRSEKSKKNPNFLVRIFSGGVGVFHVNGWGPKSSIRPSKPAKSNFLGGISRDFAGISRGRPKSLRKKSLGSIFVPYITALF